MRTALYGLLAALLFIVIVMPSCFVEAQGVYTLGASSAITNITFNDYYYDSCSVKAGETKKIEVPRGKTGYNLFLTNTGQASQEESLKAAIIIDRMWPVEHNKDSIPYWWGPGDFGYDNNKDTVYYYGGFSYFELACSTSTAGASAAESLLHVIYRFAVPNR